MKIKSLLLLGLLTMTGMNAFADDYKVEGIVYTYTSATGNATVKAISSGMTDANAKTITIKPKFTDGDGNEHKVTGFEATWYSGTGEKDITNITETLEVDLANFAATAFNDATISNLTKLATLKLKKTGDYDVPVFTKIKNLDLTGISGTSKFKSAYPDATTILETINATAATFDANVFSGQTKIKSVKNVKSVGNSAFGSAGAANLEVTLLEGAEIGEAAFAASKLKTINMAMAKKIGADAFKMCTALTVADLSGAESVGSNAFNASGVTSLTIPASITKDGIAAGAFSGMTLDNVAIVNNNIETIGKWFNGSTVKALTITSTSVKTIDTEAFENVSLQTVDLSGATALETIGTTAFNNNQLKAVKIPATVKTIGEMAFRLNSLADGVDFSEATALESIATKAFVSGTFTTIDLSAATALATVADDAFPQNAYTSVKLQGTALDNANFVNAQSWFGPATAANSLETLTLPDALTTINNLNDYTKLTTIALPANLETIQDYAFTRSALTSIVIPAKVKTIGAYAFSECAALESVDFSAATALQTIGGYAFQKSGLTSVKIPATLKKINGDTFSTCAALESVDFSEAASLEEIGGYAFFGTKLTTLDLDGAVKLKTIQKTSFPHNAYEIVKTYGTALAGEEGDPAKYYDNFSHNFGGATGEILENAKASLTELTLPKGLQTVEENQFKDFTALESLGLPGSVNEIEDKAFYGMTGLKSFKIRSNITRIGVSAFQGCENLATVIFSDAASLTTIDNKAFADCPALTSIDFTGAEKLATIGTSAFDGTGLTTVKIPATVTTIGQSAFAHAKLESVDFSEAEALEKILGSAFNGNAKLLDIDLDGAVKLTSIADNAFDAVAYKSVKANQTGLCWRDDADVYHDEFSTPFRTILGNAKESLTTVTLPVGLEVVVGGAGDGFFAGFTALETISLPKAVRIIGQEAFKGSGLTSIKIRENVEEINKDAFADCHGLATANLADAAALTTIGDGAFSGSDADHAPVITSVVIPAKVASIGTAAFLNCAVLADVDFTPAVELTRIGGLAFGGTAITEIDLSKCAKLATIHDAYGKAFPANEYTTLKLAGTLLPIDEIHDQIDLSKATETLATVSLPGANEEVGFAGTIYIPMNMFGNRRYATNVDDPKTYKPFTALKTISLPKSVKQIGAGAFAGAGLTAFKFRANIEGIGNAAFADCKDLATLNFSEATKLTYIGTSAFLRTAVTEVVIPENENEAPTNTLYIGPSAFRESKVKTFSAKSWSGTISARMFKDSKLVGLKVPTTITGIGEEAFSGCTKFASLVFQYGDKDNGLYPAGIGDKAFAGCVKLESLDLSSTKLAGISSTTPFKGCTALAEITFPEKGFTYLTSPNLFSDCPIVNLDAPTVTSTAVLFGTYWSEDDADYVARDEDHANTTLQSVRIGGNVVPQCFAWCTGLESVEYFNDQVSTTEIVQNNAFDFCTGLTTFTYLPTKVVAGLRIADKAFHGCTPYVHIVTNTNYMDWVMGDVSVGGYGGKAPVNATFGDADITKIKTVQDKANASQFVGKYVNNSNWPAVIDAADAKVFSIYVDGDKAYFQALRTYDGKYYIEGFGSDKNHVIIKTEEAKEVEIKYAPTATRFSVGFDDVYDSKADDELVDVQDGVGLGAGQYLYRLTNSAGLGFGFTAFTGTTIKEGQFFVACSKKPEGVGRLTTVWLDEDGNVINEEATGIETIESNDVNNGDIFNMQGVRVEKAQKGIYIQNGKKIVVK